TPSRTVVRTPARSLPGIRARARTPTSVPKPVQRYTSWAQTRKTSPKSIGGTGGAPGGVKGAGREGAWVASSDPRHGLEGIGRSGFLPHTPLPEECIQPALRRLFVDRLQRIEQVLFAPPEGEVAQPLEPRAGYRRRLHVAKHVIR